MTAAIGFSLSELHQMAAALCHELTATGRIDRVPSSERLVLELSSLIAVEAEAPPFDVHVAPEPAPSPAADDRHGPRAIQPMIGIDAEAGGAVRISPMVGLASDAAAS